MAIQTSFKFQHAHAPTAVTAKANALVAPHDWLGLLRGLVGGQAQSNSQRTWQGTGFNMIWRPNSGPEFGGLRHFLQLNMTSETLDFKEISGTSGIANRGLLQEDIFLGGLAYTQEINDSFDGSGQHFEPGVFNNVPPTSDPLEPVTVVRMGSIPHGTTINLQGTATTGPQPAIPAVSITPFQIGNPAALVSFPEEVLTNAAESRTDLVRVANLTQAQLSNPNLFLIEAQQGQTIERATVIELSSDSTVAGAVPDAGGGVDNIAFLIGTGSGPNAVAPKVTCTFWIQEGIDRDGSPLLQLQYSQVVLLDFGGLSWPHITVATLRPVP